MIAKKTRQVSYDCDIGDIVYVDNTGIYHRIDYKKHAPYRINEVLTNIYVQV